MTEPDIALESPAAPARLAELHENLAAAPFGCDRIHIEIQNEGACRLFERLGYKVFGALPNYEGHNTLYYLEKSLS